ncbi:MAG: ferritin-like domain-containing protein [Planctomycetota bacterium]|jgi:rubrerythrin
MEFKSTTDILEFSISKEKASIQFYRDLLRHLSDSTTQSLFEVLIQKEQEHVGALQFEIEKLGHTVDTDIEKPDSTFLWDERLETDEPVSHMSFVDALLLAIQKERAAFRLYAKLLATVKDEELCGVLLELAEEEMRHVLQIMSFDGCLIFIPLRMSSRSQSV